MPAADDDDDDYGASRYRTLALILVVPWIATVVVSFYFAAPIWTLILFFAGVFIIFIQFILGLMARDAEEDVVEDFQKWERLGGSSTSRWVGADPTCQNCGNRLPPSGLRCAQCGAILTQRVPHADVPPAS